VKPTVVLFDIDGTLVSCGGAGRRALVAALSELHGPGDVLDFSFGGLTDRAIVRAGLRAAGVPDDSAAIDRVIERYLVLLPAQVEASPGYRVMPGVMELLGALGGRSMLAVGLGTGNVRPGAHAKLARAGLAERFRFGGFGCDDEDRAELCAAGARRGAAELGVPRDECRVVIIGDTPRDIAAAHAIGAECVAVATGDHGEAELAAAGADHTVADLSAALALRAIYPE
jgi:phosphoglycolate phosphatase-like HAD superfamily hydrolase